MKKFIVFLLAAVGAFAASSPDVGLRPATSWAAAHLMNQTSASGVLTELGLLGGTVKDVKLGYGAKGDGATDDTAAIVAAFAAANSGDTVYFPPGVYPLLTNSIYVEGKSIRIEGVPGLSIISNRVATTTSSRGMVFRATRSASSKSALVEPLYESSTATTVDVADGSLFNVGSYVMLYDTSRTTNWSLTDVINQEILRVDAKSGNTLTFNRAPKNTYKTQYSAQVANFTSGDTAVDVYGITMYGYGFEGSLIHNSRFDKCTVMNSDSLENFYFSYTSDCVIVDCEASAALDKTPPSTGYAFSINGGVNNVINRFRSLFMPEANISYAAWGTIVRDCLFDKTQDLNVHGVGERFTQIKGNLFNNCYLVVNAGAEFGARDTTIEGNKFAGSFGSVGKISSSPVTGVGVTFNTGTGGLGATVSYYSNGGLRNGHEVMFYGTMPTEVASYKVHYIIAPTATNFSISTIKPRPAKTVTFTEGTSWTCTIGSGWFHQDVVTFDGLSLPTGLTAGRQYYFAQSSSGVEWLAPYRAVNSTTFDHTTERVTLPTGYADGNRIHFEGSGSTPAALSKGTAYYLKHISGGTVFELSASSGGATIPFADNGSGTIYTCIAFTGTGSGNIYAEGGTPFTFSGSPASNFMAAPAYGVEILGNEFGGLQAEAIQLSRFGNVLIANNMIGEHGPFSLSTPIGVNLLQTDGVTIEGNKMKELVAGAYGVKFDTTRNTRVLNNVWNTPAATTLFNATASSTNQAVILDGNVYVNHATRALVISTNLIPGIRAGGYSLNNFYGGSGFVEGRGATVTSASIATASPGTVGSTIIALADLTATCNIDIDDGYWFPNDQMTVIRRGAGAFDLVVRKKSDASTLFTIPNGWYGYGQFFNEAVTNGIVKGITYTNNVALP